MSYIEPESTDKYRLILCCIGTPQQLSEYLQTFAAELCKPLPDNCIGDQHLSTGIVPFDYDIRLTPNEHASLSQAFYEDFYE